MPDAGTPWRPAPAAALPSSSMPLPAPPSSSVRAPRHLVASADHLATSAGMTAFALGGNAVDAAIATNAAIAVTGPHLCGMGGDLLALVHLDDPSSADPGTTYALNASGRAGSGADPDRLPADGFPASPLLVGSLRRLDATSRSNLDELASQATSTGARVRRPGVALALAGLPVTGRDGYYGGAFGDGLVEIGGGEITEADLLASHADWVAPLTTTAFGGDLHTS